MQRRQFLARLAAGLPASLALPSLAALPQLSLAASQDAAIENLAVAAAWRGPSQGDTYMAGILDAHWDADKLAIRYATVLPGRAHDIHATADGGLLAVAYRFGDWLLRSDAQGKVMRQISLRDEGSRLMAGHAAWALDGSVLYVTEIDTRDNQGWVSVRDAQTFKKLAEWRTQGADPHQLVVDHDGSLLVANGGVARNPQTDRKLSLTHMQSSLARLDGQSGKLLGQWQLDDPRLSLRHLAWNRSGSEQDALLGIAMLAEHEDAATRAQAPVLALFDGEKLSLPSSQGDGIGYCGNIVAAHGGGFMLSSTANKALLWHPGIPQKLQTVVDMRETYALAAWPGPDQRGGVIIATAVGLLRWHPSLPPKVLAWPQPMALDNHWMLAPSA